MAPILIFVREFAGRNIHSFIRICYIPRWQLTSQSDTYLKLYETSRSPCHLLPHQIAYTSYSIFNSKSPNQLGNMCMLRWTIPMTSSPTRASVHWNTMHDENECENMKSQFEMIFWKRVKRWSRATKNGYSETVRSRPTSSFRASHRRRENWISWDTRLNSVYVFSHRRRRPRQ